MSMRGTAARCVVLALALAGCKDGTGSQPRTPAKLEVTAGDAQSGAAGAALASPVAATVTDGSGRPVANQVVSFTVVSGGGSVAAGAVTTGTDGTARTVWTLGGAAGEQRLEARLVPAGAAAALADTARATAGPAAPAAVVVVSAATVSDTAGRTLADSVTVRVRDTFGNPVPGVTVTFAPTGGGTASPATAVTRADGTARTAWTLGTTAGTQTLQASTAGAAPATATATAVPRNRLQLVTQVNGTILDADASRVLWWDLTPAGRQVFLRTLGGGDQLVGTTEPGYFPDQGFLTPYGAVYGARPATSHSGIVYEWRGGAPAIIGYFSPEGTLRVAGTYAAWLENTTLRLRDLAANTLTTVATNAKPSIGLSPNGTVAYATGGPSPNTVQVYRNGTNTTAATTTSPTLLWHPLTDGVNLLYLRSSPFSNLHIALVLRTPSATDTVTVTDYVAPTYLLTNGWVAFSNNGGTYRRSPAGTIEQVSPWHSELEALAPDGTLLFRINPTGSAWEQELAAPGSPVQPLGAGTSSDRGYFAGGSAYVISSGFRLYRVVP